MAVPTEATLSLSAGADEQMPPELTLRAQLNRRVRTFADGRHLPYSDVWNLLYRELRDRCRFDARARARQSGRAPLDEVERAGKLEVLWRIACQKLQ